MVLFLYIYLLFVINHNTLYLLYVINYLLKISKMILSLPSYLLYLELSIPLFKSVCLPAMLFLNSYFFFLLPERGFILYVYTSGLLRKNSLRFCLSEKCLGKCLESNALKNILKTIILSYIFEGIFIPSTF